MLKANSNLTFSRACNHYTPRVPEDVVNMNGAKGIRSSNSRTPNNKSLDIVLIENIFLSLVSEAKGLFQSIYRKTGYMASVYLHL